MQLGGLHHVTAVTGKASQNVAFYTQMLGMRLVKKTVNQDDVSAYHLFYADGVGSPGTDLTFFDWPQTLENRNGAGSIARVALRAPSDEALHWWAQRLDQAGIANNLVEEDQRAALRFSDPEGLALEMISDDGAGGSVPWELSPAPTEMGITGLYAVKLVVRELEPLARVLTEVMGFEALRHYREGEEAERRVVVYGLEGGGPGKEVHVEAGPLLPQSRLGRGGVHHVAFRTPDDLQQRRWLERISTAGLRVTEVIDRYYFKSIYFRAPGGILFEIATDGPGFTEDEDVHRLGERLALPPFLEAQRETIAAQLQPLEIPQA